MHLGGVIFVALSLTRLSHFRLLFMSSLVGEGKVSWGRKEEWRKGGKEEGKNNEGRGMRYNQMTSTVLITTAMPLKNQRCQPPALERKLNAAPVLCCSVRSNQKNTSTGRP